MNRSLLFAVLLAFGCSCRKITPSPSGSTSGPATKPTAADPEPPPVLGAPSAPVPIAPLSSGARIQDERNTITVFRDSAPSVVFVTQTRMVVDYLAGTTQ